MPIKQSLADIRFVWVKENEYPLAYIRENKEEKILVNYGIYKYTFLFKLFMSSGGF